MYCAIYLAVSTLTLFGISGVFSDDCSHTRPALLPTCDSQIYCYGTLLEDVQLAKIYNDSKTFVDLKLKYPEADVLLTYNKLRSQFGGTPPEDILKEFLAANFENGEELEEWTPPDFKEAPCLAKRVTDPEFKTWVEQINYIFRNLSRKVRSDVEENPELYSLLYVPNGFVIPGGRFTELYYWDSYWILNGLLLLDMKQTAKGVIENLVYLYRIYGIIPNGSRKYYLRRSQPPLLTPMVLEYYDATNDLEFVREIIDVLESEFNFWMTKHTVQIVKGENNHRLARYYAPSCGPRPESYREDYSTVENEIDEDDKNQVYVDLKSVAETGWDFSTRWIIKDGTNQGNLSDTKSSCIVPVDLNAFLHYSAQIISKFYSIMGNWKKASEFNIRANELLMDIHSVLWNEERGIWLDYDLKNKKPRDYFSASNLFPLWTGSYLQTTESVSRYALDYLKWTEADKFIGGIPTTMVKSGLQWDFPNGWAPLQAIIVEGLEKLGTPEAKEEARELAEKWIQNSFIGFHKYNVMFEKYSVSTPGETGGGGEYDAQTGFGWSNGVVLKFLSMYYSSTTEEC